MSPTPPPPAPSNLPAPKKVGPLVWILGGCAVLIVLAVLALTLGGLFVMHKVKQAGLDPDLVRRHPELAVVKLAVAANPDAEIVSIDEDKGIVTVLDKKTGKTVTMNFEDIKKGKLTFESEGKKVEVEGHGEGDTGSFTVKTGEGTARFGAGAVKLPDWLPAYAGASMQGFSAQSATGSSGTFAFKTGDSAGQVVAFYTDALTKAGFKLETMQYPNGTLLSGRLPNRTASVNIASQGAGCTVSGTFEEK